LYFSGKKQKVPGFKVFAFKFSPLIFKGNRYRTRFCVFLLLENILFDKK